MKNITVFITGVTGVLGRRVSKSLIEEGYRVVALTRSNENKVFCNQNRIEGRHGDLFNLESMIDLTRDCDVIMHLATHMPKVELPRPKDWLLNDKIRVEGTHNLVLAALQNKVKYFIQPSITFLFGDQQGNVVTEQSEISNEPLSMVKSAIRMESIIREKLSGKIPYTIFRFGMFYSEDSFHTINMIENIKYRKIPVIGKGDYYWNFTHADDAADAILFSLRNENHLQNETLHITDFNPVMFNDFISSLSFHFGAKPAYRIPDWIARLLLGKEVHGFLTNSYRIVKNEKLGNWKPNHPSIIEWVKRNYTQISKVNIQVKAAEKNNLLIKC